MLLFDLILCLNFVKFPLKLTQYVDLIVLDMFDFNVIIGMNCLSEYRAHIVCQEKRVLFSPLNGHFFEFEGTKVRPLPQMFSTMQAQRCLQFGCQGFIVNVFNMNLVT